MKKQFIAVVAARSGGHIIPGLTIAQQYCNDHPETSITIFTTHHPFDKKIIGAHGSDIATVFLPLDNIPNHVVSVPKIRLAILIFILLELLPPDSFTASTHYCYGRLYINSC